MAVGTDLAGRCSWGPLSLGAFWKLPAWWGDVINSHKADIQRYRIAIGGGVYGCGRVSLYYFSTFPSNVVNSAVLPLVIKISFLVSLASQANYNLPHCLGCRLLNPFIVRLALPCSAKMLNKIWPARDLDCGSTKRHGDSFSGAFLQWLCLVAMLSGFGHGWWLDSSFFWLAYAMPRARSALSCRCAQSHRYLVGLWSVSVCQLLTLNIL